MNSSNYSTKSPIVLVVGGGRDSDLVEDILNRRCSLKKINDTLNICFEKESVCDFAQDLSNLSTRCLATAARAGSML
jgi:hypothetical protein